MLNDARPVRIVAMSCCRSESAFSILVLMLASISFTELNTGPLGAACCSVFIAMCLRNAFRLVSHLIERRGRTVIVHPKVVQNAQRRSSGANRGHVVLQVRERLFHSGVDARLDFFHRVEHGTAG